MWIIQYEVPGQGIFKQWVDSIYPEEKNEEIYHQVIVPNRFTFSSTLNVPRVQKRSYSFSTQYSTDSDITPDENTTSSPTTTSSTVSSDSTSVTKSTRKKKPVYVNLLKPKKKFFDRRVSPFPRVLKRDIRRDYGTMLVNVLNATDHDLLSKFFHHFSHPSLKLYDFFPEAPSYIPPIRLVNGLDQIVYHLFRETTQVPDFICQICDYQLVENTESKRKEKKNVSYIHQRLDVSGSQVRINVRFLGTHIFQGNIIQVLKDTLQRFGGESNYNPYGLPSVSFPPSNNFYPSSYLNHEQNEYDSDNSENSTSSTLSSISSSNMSTQSLEALSGKFTISSDLNESIYNSLAIPLSSLEQENSKWNHNEMDNYLESNAQKILMEIENKVMNVQSSSPSIPSTPTCHTPTRSPSPSYSTSPLYQSNNLNQMQSQSLEDLIGAPFFPSLNDNNISENDFINNCLSQLQQTESFIPKSVSLSPETLYKSIRPEPITLGVEGTIRMHLDSTHHIYRLEFVSSSIFKNTQIK